MTERALDDGLAFERSVAEPEVFTVIFDRHYRSVYRYLSRRVGNTVADDLAAETFILAFERRAAYRPSSKRALPWLLGIAINLLAHHRRSEARHLRALAASNSGGSTPPSEETAPRDDAEMSQRLVAGLEQLDDYDREVLLLYAWAELKYEEIADVLDIPIGTVRSRLNRARRKVRRALELHSDPNVIRLQRREAHDA
jgi:RNA polymerase sigma-70 factor (ECF subfamily)